MEFMKDKKRAFTLAEVMIALSLVGVLATFSIPTIGSSVHRRAKLSEFRAAYALLDNALKNSYSEHGTIYSCYDVPNKDSTIDGGYTIASGTSEVFRGCDGLEPVFLRNMGFTRKCIKDPVEEGCVPDGYPLNKPHFNTKRAYVLNNSMIIFPSRTQGLALFAVDINGRKGPNRWGQDIFPFSIMITNSQKAGTGQAVVKTVEIAAPNDELVKEYFIQNPLVDTTREMFHKVSGRLK